MVSMALPEARVRLVFLGAAGVGKTALIRRFLQDSFEARYRRTVEELHVLELELDPPGPALRLRLEILDTSGSYSFPAMRRLCICRGDAFALVCSPDQPASFEEAQRLRDEILEAKPAAAIVVVANKSDLAAPAGPEAEAPSGRARLAATVQRDWGARYVEASAKQGSNVVSLFQELLGRVSLLSGRLSPALRRRSNPEAVAKEPPARRRLAKSPSCAIC
ncbi:ras-related protein Rap-1b-like [Hemicordylus capensis]|uniref:ras-related protein Rap-1b-like n=1 Tax=Hemicordylus capensis TaxID=884348 RepID=UPI0023024C0E|nr:ras-related protein Rap-1b-like [Hemicordylus capensis]